MIPDRRKLSEWVYDNVTLPSPPYAVGGQLDLSISPYLIEPLNALQENRVKEVVCCGAPRTGKSLIHDSFIIYALLNDPGDILLIHHTQVKMKTWYNSRLSKLLKVNRKVRFSENRFDTTNSLVLFPQLTLRMGGAQSEKELTSLGYRYALGDEVWQWKQGLLQQFKNRTNDFPHTKKIVLVSSPSCEKEDFHNEWCKGQQAEFGFKCPKCGFIQPYVFSKEYPYKKGEKKDFGGLCWDENTTTKPQDIWNITEAEKTAHYKCINPSCKARFEDTEQDKRMLLRNGCYIVGNDTAPNDIRSYRWNALCSLNITYAELVREFLTARKLAKNGNYSDLRNFYMEKLSIFWKDSLTEDEIQPLSKVGDDEEELPQDSILFGTADVQESGNKVVYEVFSFSKAKKEAQQIAYGVVDSFDHVSKIFKDLKVKDQNILCDSGGNITREVYKQCAIHGHKGNIKGVNKPVWFCWSATKGEEVKNEQYWHSDLKAFRWYSQRKRQDAGYGTKEAGKLFCPFYTFSNKVAKDTLKKLLEGKHDWKWFILPEAQADKNYISQLNSESPKLVTDKWGKKTYRWVKDVNSSENNFWDTSVLQVVAASVSGILS